jgi:hypothetical protein
MKFHSIAGCIGLLLWVGGCQKNQQPYHPIWFPGNTEVWVVTVDLKTNQPNQTSAQWASQSMKLHIQVDSLSPDSSVHFHATLSDVKLTSRDRDSSESAFITAVLSNYAVHMKLSPLGALEIIQEGMVWPSLGPAWVSPISLLHWVLPAWELSLDPSIGNAPAMSSISLHTLGPDSCQWDREQKVLTNGGDSLAYHFEWYFKPHFSGLSLTCPELPWKGLAHFRGERMGFGLKDFKWSAEAHYLPPNDSVAIGEKSVNSPLRLTREVLLRRL